MIIANSALRASLAIYRSFSASTTATATTTPQIKNLIGRVKKNKRAARAARTHEQVRAVLYKTTTRNYHIYRTDDSLSIQP